MALIIGYGLRLLFSYSQNDPGCKVPGGRHKFYTAVGDRKRGCINCGRPFYKCGNYIIQSK